MKEVQDHTQHVEDPSEALFRAHFTLICQNADMILSDEKWKNVLISERAIAGAAYFGGGYLPLGFLLRFWPEDQRSEPCKECHGAVYICGTSGSPLSGRGESWGICATCHKIDTFGFHGEIWARSREEAGFKDFQRLVSDKKHTDIADMIAHINDTKDTDSI